MLKFFYSLLTNSFVPAMTIGAGLFTYHALTITALNHRHAIAITQAKAEATTEANAAQIVVQRQIELKARAEFANRSRMLEAAVAEELTANAVKLKDAEARAADLERALKKRPVRIVKGKANTCWTADVVRALR